MKPVKRNLLIIGLAAAMALPALTCTTTHAQGTNPLAPPLTLSLSNAPSSVPDFFTRAFGVHDPTKEYFANTNEFELEFGAAYNANHGGIDQSTTADFWHRISPSSEIGGDLEVDSLGVAGQDLDLLAVHANYRIDWDNVAGGISAGGYRDFAQNAWGGEVGILGEYRLTPGVGAFLRYYVGYEDGAAVAKKLTGRLIFGVTIALGK